MSQLVISDKVNARSKEDIKELNDRIQEFYKGDADEEKFRSFRLARGVYGQRQEGVQMIRIKLPYGKMTAKQLVRIADIADKYATEKMHCTTRQDIQIHYVKMADAPQLWAELEDAGITLKEACGNTVRNVTGAPIAGIDPKEAFDITPYAHAFFEYFLRNPICQEMGRKFKVAFSSNETDNALGFMHDIGLIPKIQNGVKGFKVLVAGGLGSQPMLAQDAFDFIPSDELIPFAEAVIRVFDRHGERTSRGKARMKFLIKKIGYEAFVQLVEEQKSAVINKKVIISEEGFETDLSGLKTSFEQETPIDQEAYDKWLATNVIEQKQAGYKAVTIRLTLGNIYNETARALAAIVAEGYAADDIRVSINQGFVLRFVPENGLINLFNKLQPLGLVKPGFDSAIDITTCPGTDTCNLGIASSYGLSEELERLMKEEFEELIYNHDIKIKISGCMNACGQHNIANIGFQGMSIKKGAYVMPAMQILLGGGFNKENIPTIADKVVKVPSKNAPDAFRGLMNDFNANSLEGEYFNNYYQRKLEEEKMYFFNLLKPYTKVEVLTDDYFVDWGTNENYVKAVGVGECAGVILDLVGTLILESKEKMELSTKALENGRWDDSIYFSYLTYVLGAKALLIGEDVKCNTHASIISDFEEKFVSGQLINLDGATFSELALQLNSNEPTLEFAQKFNADAIAFYAKVNEAREAQIKRGTPVSID